MVLLEDDGERQDLYRVLAELFVRSPDEETLEDLRESLSLESGEAAEEIREDFQNLFAFPGGKLQPMESRSGAETALAVRDVALFYEAAGLEIGEECELPPDHLSLELLFMSYLVENRRTELQGKFLEEHLMNWVPYYCETVMKEAETVFYREIAELTRDFLNRESEEFSGE